MNRLLVILFLLVCTSQSQPWNDSQWDNEQYPQHWIDKGHDSVRTRLAIDRDNEPAHNAILFIGDGMGIGTTSSGRIFSGQLKHLLGESYETEIDKFPHVGLSKTYNIDRQTPDSAATATAYLCGVKARSGTIGVNGLCKRKDKSCCGKHEVQSILVAAKKSGKATGIVTTTRITHASPASAFAHSPDRDWETYDKYNFGWYHKFLGCHDIAEQVVDSVDFLDVIIAGGRQNFLPIEKKDPEYPDKTGKRVDGRDLTIEWLNKVQLRHRKQGKYVWSANQFYDIDANSVEHLLALLEPSHMPYELDRINKNLTDPSLAEMVKMAIAILKKNSKGFVLFVEGGRIDHAHHDSKAHYSLMDFVAMDEAVKVAVTNTDKKKTQIVVSADHSHVFTIYLVFVHNDSFDMNIILRKCR